MASRDGTKFARTRTARMHEEEHCRHWPARFVGLAFEGNGCLRQAWETSYVITSRDERRVAWKVIG